jgi:16S rRNA processing protein RimM
VRAPRGVRGELSVASLTEFPERFRRGSTLWAGGVAYTVRLARSFRATLLLQLEGITTRAQAEALRGRLLEVPLADLQPLDADRYYRFQLVGMAVNDIDGRPLGRLEEVLETGANDVYVVRNEDGELLVPAIDTVVRDVDVPGRRMVVELPPQLERLPVKRARRARPGR